jgi:formylglycine-generating enzyme required for sulfatase activity
VTQKQWRDAVTGLRKVDLELDAAPSNFKGDDLPVEQVSWNDCAEMIKRLNASGDGFVYDFPTEAEWEYACRAGTTTPFFFGDILTKEQANYDGNDPYGKGSKGKYRQETTPVGNYPANDWGLHDMHGNVWEWCRDRWHENYQGAPTDGSAWESGGSELRVLRGGSWLNNAVNCRSANRSWFVPGRRNYSVGFRCVIRSART